ncbi:MAG: hypothetical protein COB59_08270 [Rhodospirillaceae bacterium]|nr:MAG: hypothetical protein COB59_08270 [Rhodospirillaceae bacterium]
MIHESYPWKDNLLNDAKKIDEECKKKEDTEERYILLEKTVFLSAFVMRKLLDSRKLSSAFDDEMISCIKYPSKPDDPAFKRPREDILSDRLYDFENPIKDSLSLRKLLGIIVHSLVFTITTNADESVEGFIINSDINRLKGLWFIDFKVFINLMKKIGDDYPAQMLEVFNISKNSWYRWRGSVEVPADVREKIRQLYSDLEKA